MNIAFRTADGLMSAEWCGFIPLYGNPPPIIKRLIPPKTPAISVFDPVVQLREVAYRTYQRTGEMWEGMWVYEEITKDQK
jgi:hypothetical protein